MRDEHRWMCASTDLGSIPSRAAISAASSSVAAGHVEVVLGADAALPASAPATPSATSSGSGSPVAIPSTGAQGGAVNAKNGIPCVN